MELFYIFFLIINAFETYTLYKFFGVFYDRTNVNKKRERISYLVYFIFNSAIYLIFRTPIMTMVCCITSLFLITFNYKSVLKKRILTVIYIYVFLFCIEVIVVIVLGKLSIVKFYARNNYFSEFVYATIALSIYMVSLLLSKNRKVSRDIETPFSYWLGVILVPISSIIILGIIFLFTDFSQKIVLILTILIFIINFAVFYLYDNIINIFSENEKIMFFEQKSIFYENELNLIKESVDANNRLKHDMKNHLFTMYSLQMMNDTEKLNSYFSEIIEKLDEKNKYVSTENLVIDSIVNFKLKEIESLGTTIEASVDVPTEINISNVTLTTIIGNLLDNAKTALEKASNKRLYLKIKHMGDGLFIQIENSFDGKIKEENGKFETQKVDKKNHGMGLESVKSVVKKCDGDISISYENNVFSVLVILDEI